ncbi:50S ribosomal protein L13 [Candidatus Woesearchaeota archaeon]|nr:50S ribosomal protein L13 [Candidatus Woesearchaeota archaeon]
MIIDATNLILGRLATKAAKQALQGEDIVVVNCEKAVITGDKKQAFASYDERMQIGQVNQGPYFQRRPDMFVRRAIRGMLPWRKPRGRMVFGRVNCHIGMPPQIKPEDAKTIPEADVKRIKKASHITINELCKHIGYKTR